MSFNGDQLPYRSTVPWGDVKTWILADAPGGSGVPTGTIVMWSGLNGAIPSGWQECDGSNGTPDLREKFIYGRSAGKVVDTTGGSATHGHSDNLTHSGTAVDGHAAQSHTAHSGTAVSNHTNVAVPATATAAVKIGTSTASAGAQTHTHTIATITHSVTQPSAHSDHAALPHTVTQATAHGAHAAVNSEPPYYVLIFIQKMP